MRAMLEVTSGPAACAIAPAAVRPMIPSRQHPRRRRRSANVHLRVTVVTVWSNGHQQACVTPVTNRLSHGRHGGDAMSVPRLALYAASAAALVAALSGCSSAANAASPRAERLLPRRSAPPPGEQPALVVYSAQGYDAPVTKAFTAATGIPVNAGRRQHRSAADQGRRREEQPAVGPALGGRGHRLRRPGQAGPAARRTPRRRRCNAAGAAAHPERPLVHPGRAPR